MLNEIEIADYPSNITITSHRQTNTQLGKCLSTYGSFLGANQGQAHRALLLLLESIALLKGQALPKESQWAAALYNALTSAGYVFDTCGRLQEAADLLEECREVERRARMTPSFLSRFTETSVYLKMGQHERALTVGQEAMRILSAEVESGLSLLSNTDDERMHPVLCARLTSALEGLGRMDESRDYSQQAIDRTERLGADLPDVITCWDRGAREMSEAGMFVEAERIYCRPLDFYTCWFEEANRIGWAADMKLFVPVMRRLVEVKRKLGKEIEARALEQELDETEAIVECMVMFPLQELREEMQ